MTIIRLGDKVRVLERFPTTDRIDVGYKGIVDKIVPPGDGGARRQQGQIFFISGDPAPFGMPDDFDFGGDINCYGWATRVELVQSQVMPESWWHQQEKTWSIEVDGRGAVLAPAGAQDAVAPVITDPDTGEVLSPNDALRRAWNGGQVDVAPPAPKEDVVNHPSHYTVHPSGVECIDVVEWMSFNRGNAIKYLWRAGQKDPAREIEDLEKAAWYVNREIDRIRRVQG